MHSLEDLNVQYKTIFIEPLKKFALEQLPNSSSLKTILVLEKDYLTIPEFITKMEIWIKLLNNEYKGEPRT